MHWKMWAMMWCVGGWKCENRSLLTETGGLCYKKYYKLIHLEVLQSGDSSHWLVFKMSCYLIWIPPWVWFTLRMANEFILLEYWVIHKIYENPKIIIALSAANFIHWFTRTIQCFKFSFNAAMFHFRGWIVRLFCMVCKWIHSQLQCEWLSIYGRSQSGKESGFSQVYWKFHE